MRKAVVPLLGVFLALWFVSDPRGLADAAGSGGGRAWEATGDVVDSAVAFLGER